MRGRDVIFSSKKMDHLTPPDLFEHLDSVFNFKLDPAANPKNNLGLEKTYVRSGITYDWPVSSFCNPPYDNVDLWVNKIVKESECHPENNYAILLPSRTDRPWFGKLFETASAICFFNKRLRFFELTAEEDKGIQPEKYVAPFPSLIAVYVQGPHLFTEAQVKMLNTIGNVIYFNRPVALLGDRDKGNRLTAPYIFKGGSGNTNKDLIQTGLNIHTSNLYKMDGTYL